jgi:hypothetical protein
MKNKQRRGGKGKDFPVRLSKVLVERLYRLGSLWTIAQVQLRVKVDLDKFGQMDPADRRRVSLMNLGARHSYINEPSPHMMTQLRGITPQQTSLPHTG